MTILKKIKDLVVVKASDHDECIDTLSHDFVLNDVEGNIRFHHLKFDGNGRPMVKALAELLYQYIIDYCIASKNRAGSLSAQQAAQLTKMARQLFRHPALSADTPDETGEAGETLLFLLIESVLQAPQLVAKMELKTNHRDEIKGSDGIHFKWCEEDNVVDFYFGESKLYKNVNDAIRSALKSIDDFHANEMYKHEFSMVTKHFKYADQAIRDEITEFVKYGEPSKNARINHACLIGYDWRQYQDLPPKQLNAKFQESLRIEGAKIAQYLNEKFTTFPRKYLRFEIFFFPFPSVSEFRKEFNESLN